MSSFWSLFIIVLVVGNIAGMLWLLFATAKKIPGERQEENQPVETTGHEWDGITELNNPLPRWWLWLFLLTVVFSVVYLVLYPGLGAWAGTLGWSQTGQHQAEIESVNARQEVYFAEYRQQDIPQLAKNDAAMQTAGRLYANNCAICHGSDAQGAPGFPNLADDDWLYGGSPEQIQHSIANGRSGVMPAMGGAVGEKGVYELSHYLISLSRGSKDTMAIEAGQKRFAMTCAACHGADAKGNQALGAPDLTDDTWLHGRSLSQIQMVIREGRTGNMPAHQDLLGDDKVRLLAAYVYSLSQEN